MILSSIAIIVSLFALVINLRALKRSKENLRFWESELERQEQLWKEGP